jgi:hypothetical protein
MDRALLARGPNGPIKKKFQVSAKIPEKIGDCAKALQRTQSYKSCGNLLS